MSRTNLTHAAPERPRPTTRSSSRAFALPISLFTFSFPFAALPSSFLPLPSLPPSHSCTARAALTTLLRHFHVLWVAGGRPGWAWTGRGRWSWRVCWNASLSLATLCLYLDNFLRGFVMQVSAWRARARAIVCSNLRDRIVRWVQPCICYVAMHLAFFLSLSLLFYFEFLVAMRAAPGGPPPRPREERHSTAQAPPVPHSGLPPPLVLGHLCVCVCVRSHVCAGVESNVRAYVRVCACEAAYMSSCRGSWRLSFSGRELIR